MKLTGMLMHTVAEVVLIGGFLGSIALGVHYLKRRFDSSSG